MYSYIGAVCPVCRQKLFEDDDVVVCPVCGTPHHRHCYKEIGHCYYSDRHDGVFQWSSDTNTQASEQVNTETINTHQQDEDHSVFNNDKNTDQADLSENRICPFCKNVNSPEADFCIKCGHSLNPNSARPNYQNAPNPHPVMMIADPYGGVDPKEEIDGVSVSELACYVGSNSAYYIPRFKAMSKSKNPFSVNWSALIIGPYWMAFRKLYLVSIILTVVMCLVGAPLELLITPELTSNITSALSSLPGFLVPLLCGLTVLIHFITGFLGNYIYMKHCLNRVKKLSQQRDNFERFEFLKHLTLNGNVSMNKAFVIYFLSAILQTLMIYFLITLL